MVASEFRKLQNRKNVGDRNRSGIFYNHCGLSDLLTNAKRYRKLIRLDIHICRDERCRDDHRKRNHKSSGNCPGHECSKIRFRNKWRNQILFGGEFVWNHPKNVSKKFKIAKLIFLAWKFKWIFNTWYFGLKFQRLKKKKILVRLPWKFKMSFEFWRENSNQYL